MLPTGAYCTQSDTPWPANGAGPRHLRVRFPTHWCDAIVHRGHRDRAQSARKGTFMELKAGVQLKSAVSTTEVVVVRAPKDEVTLTCGGAPMLGRDEESSGAAIQAGDDGSSLLGKRYVDETSEIEVLCTKPGDGTLAVDGRALELKSAKPLPSSD
jgi:hypothetical protein